MFLQAQFQAIATYFGQSLDVIAFLIGLIFVLCLFLGLLYAAFRFRQHVSAPMMIVAFGTGVAVVTFLQWWTPWILAAFIIIGAFALFIGAGGVGEIMGRVRG